MRHDHLWNVCFVSRFHGYTFIRILFHPMTTIGTPLHVSILLHCHTTTTRYPNYEAPAVQEYLNNLLDEDAIYWHTGDPQDCFRTTEKGRAWVAAICATPPPVQCWKDANGKVIEL
jgi:hypothetical protein